MDFSEYDKIDDFALNEILWRSIKGPDAPLPPAVRRAIAYRPARRGECPRPTRRRPIRAGVLCSIRGGPDGRPRPSGHLRNPERRPSEWSPSRIHGVSLPIPGPRDVPDRRGAAIRGPGAPIGPNRRRADRNFHPRPGEAIPRAERSQSWPPAALGRTRACARRYAAASFGNSILTGGLGPAPSEPIARADRSLIEGERSRSAAAVRNPSRGRLSGPEPASPGVERRQKPERARTAIAGRDRSPRDGLGEAVVPNCQGTATNIVVSPPTPFDPDLTRSGAGLDPRHLRDREGHPNLWS